ncbi:hypothetical protein AB0958_30400 [Streptomyces sp. NPDC006655]|uniref:hypothetical protein n=1 Tax=Streptomyces sp. NPDC006655 TaxID=3156898 RepID=UPI0034560711
MRGHEDQPRLVPAVGVDQDGAAGGAVRPGRGEAREQACCSFFTFTTTPGEDLIGLDIAVEAAHETVLDAIAARTVRVQG